METVLSPLAVATIADLSKRRLTIAAAESLTAGMFCASLASVPGASAVLRGGLVVYATDLKHRLAGVSAATLQKMGPVAEDTAAELAEGARRTCQADIGVGLTGVAGPAAQGGHPVGTVYIGVALPQAPVNVRECHFRGSRQDIRQQSVDSALGMVCDLLDQLGY
ncbi:nicotinamide-nucleotide amidohydrolase family protein [Lawsonella clevelandensis]|uniref:CinA family protein n=1 Tax=Lawsonella clevelandensis TaxID=1528099 RepID=UPI002914EBBE|nr:nicotinamide-nucleotide amidohydrolase family protein [Lawsonella clevelandensis]MDU7193871.1 nicotinamide-nucleotide amidohydrolase family protein [Lawsonella clevelandensis]